MSKAEPPRYRLFSWEHSYSSGKVRAYLRYKAVAGALAGVRIRKQDRRLSGETSARQPEGA